MRHIVAARDLSRRRLLPSQTRIEVARPPGSFRGRSEDLVTDLATLCNSSWSGAQARRLGNCRRCCRARCTLFCDNSPHPINRRRLIRIVE